MAHFADANDTLQALNLSEDLKQALQAFVVSLSLQIGDDAKVDREGQVTQTVPFSFGRADGMSLGSNTDIVTCGLILHRLVRSAIAKFINYLLIRL
jgi:mediator of RNA polymerase II transcription subunit 5